VQIIASVDAGGRSTSQHSQLGAARAHPRSTWWWPPAHTSRPVIIRGFRAGHTVGLSASAADARQPMRGLNLLLRRSPDASPGSWTALTSCRGSASCNVRKALVC